MVIYVSDAGVTANKTSYPFTNTSPVERVPRTNSAVQSDSVTRDTEKKYVAENTPAYNISISSMGKAAVKSLESMKKAFASVNKENGNKKNAAKDNNASRAAKKYASFMPDNYSDSLSKKTYEPAEVTKTALSSDSDIITEKSNKAYKEDAVKEYGITEHSEQDDEEKSMAVNTSNLARYSRYQLQNLVNDGTITESEMNKELARRGSGNENNTSADNGPMASPVNSPAVPSIVKEAAAAYNFQMSYQISAAMLQ